MESSCSCWPLEVISARSINIRAVQYACTHREGVGRMQRWREWVGNGRCGEEVGLRWSVCAGGGGGRRGGSGKEMGRKLGRGGVSRQELEGETEDQGENSRKEVRPKEQINGEERDGREEMKVKVD